MSTEEMDPLMAELHNMEMKFSKSKQDKEYALFVLPSLETLMEMQSMSQTDRDKLRDTVAEAMDLMAAMASLDEDDPFAMMTLAAAAKVTMYTVDDHGHAVIRSAHMDDMTWRDHIIANTRVFVSDIGPYMVSTIFTGLRDNAPDGDHTLYEVGVFDTRTAALIDGMFCTNDKRAAYSVHGGFSHKWESIYAEESNDSK